MRQKLIVIGGPTASGKTKLSVELARYWNTVIVSADSRQFYQEMNIGTAKPLTSEMGSVKHYFIGSHSIKFELNVANYVAEANQLLKQLFQEHEFVVLVGGSGMFIDALCYGLDDIPHDASVQAKLNKEFQERGLAFLLNELEQCDPVYYAIVDKQNPVRIIRALEVYRATEKPYSSFRKGEKKKQNFDIHYFVIDIPRVELYERINTRVDTMIEAGLEEEVKSLKTFKHLKSLKTVGYSEWFDYFEGKYDLARCIELIKQNTRRYAKRQLTWFRKNDAIIWLDYQEDMKFKVIKHVEN